MSQLPRALSDMKEKVLVESGGVRYTSTISDYDAFASLGIDNEFRIDDFFENFSMTIKSINSKENSMVVDIIGIDTSIANALRRILLSEVATMAIEEVTMIQNTSVMQDEVLCHRLGLLPLKIDARMFDFVSKKGRMDNTNTLIFKLNVECQDTNPCTVYSSQLEWVPQKGQKELFEKNGQECPKCVNDDIIISKLAYRQKIECWMKVVKGIGRDHGKFSPVGTAFYRLLPNIEFKNDKITNIENAHVLINNCPKNVFDLINRNENKNDQDDQDNEDDNDGGFVKVARPRDCSMCRACISESHGLPNKVKLSRIKNHFIFEIESIGQYHVKDLLCEAIKILFNKCQKLAKNVQNLQAKENDDSDDNSDMENVD